MIDHRSEGKLKIDHLQIFYNCKINWIIVMKTIYLSLLLGYEYGITLIYYSKNDISRIKGHLHQRGKRAGRPSGSRPRVPQWIGLKELCGAVYTAAGPLCLRGGRPQRLLMERFFCGTRRNRECWLVGIYRSKIQCREMELQVKWNCVRTRASVNTRPARKTLPASAGGPAPRWCKCALIVNSRHNDRCFMVVFICLYCK